MVHIGYKSVFHLYERGCKKIALINTSLDLTPYADRYAGYRRAVAELGLEEVLISKESLLQGMEYGYECTLDLLDAYSDLDAIMAASDSQGIGALWALKERGVSVPGQIKVLSMTGHHIGDMLETSLTSVELPGEEISAETASMIIRAIEAGESHRALAQHLTLSASLMERESTLR